MLDYISVRGPDELQLALEKIVSRSREDRQFAAQEHFIDYHIGDQQSLLKVDARETPILCWYLDLRCRAFTPQGVKNAVASVGGVMSNITREHAMEVNKGFLEAKEEFVQTLSHMSPDQGYALLSNNKHSRKTYYLSHPRGQSYTGNSLFKVNETTTVPADNKPAPPTDKSTISNR